jgi:hypothetical protein
MQYKLITNTASLKVLQKPSGGYCAAILFQKEDMTRLNNLQKILRIPNLGLRNG